MAQIFPTDFEEKLTMAQDDYILFSDSEDGNKIKKAQYKNLKGEKGDTGTAATITVGSTTTGAAGSSASVTNSGTSSAAVLNFTIPKGDKGDTGQTGPAIISAAFNGNDIDFTEEDGNVVTLTDAKIDLKGDTGDAATVSVGTTSTLSPGSSATVTNSGTSSAAVFNFGIPKGDKGDTGDTGTAATISVGTTTTGDAGTNASVTNSGTSSAAVFNFTIPKGDKGDTGSTGAAATISVGSTSTLSPGSSATVTNSGTSSAAVFDFGIPQGATGATGNGIASITSSKAGKITTVTITETNSTVDTFQISDGQDGEGSGDVIGPASSVDGDVVLFDGTSGKLIKDSGVTLGTAASCDTGTSSGNVPLLDSNGKLNKSTLPGVALTDTFTVSTSSDLTSLSSAEQGDLAIVTTESKTYVLSAEPYSTAANWKEILSPTGGVTSVNSQTGAVTLDADDISDSTTTNKFVTASDKSTWSGKQDALTLPATPIQGNLVTWGANNKTLVDGGAIPSTADCVKTSGDQTIAGTKTFSTSPVVPNKTSDATNTGTAIATEAQVYKKQDALTTQTAYTTKGTATKVPTISTNTLGQVTAITETDITFPVTSVNGSTGAVTVSEFSPSGTASVGDVVTKTAGGYEWAAPSGGDVVVSSQSGNILTSGTKLRAGTESDYSNLGSYDSGTIYLTI